MLAVYIDAQSYPRLRCGPNGCGSEDMFKSACTAMNVDIKKMPLGQLSKAQVLRDYRRFALAFLRDANDRCYFVLFYHSESVIEGGGGALNTFRISHDAMRAPA